MADAKLDAGRLSPRQPPQRVDKVEQLDRRGKCRMIRWRNAVLAHRYAARLGDFGGDLSARQHAAVARLCPLRELHFDHLDLRIGGLRRELVRIEATLGRSTTEVAARDLPNQIAAVFAVIA